MDTQDNTPLIINSGQYKILEFCEVPNINDITLSISRADINCTITYCYSYDGNTWSKEYSDVGAFKIAFNMKNYLESAYIRIKIEAQPSETIDIENDILIIALDDVSINGKSYDYILIVQNTNKIISFGNETFNPYKYSDRAFEIKKQFDLAIAMTIGLDVIWFRTQPVGESNHTLKTHRKYETIACKKIKIVLKDNEISDSRLEYEANDIYFKPLTEIQINNQLFEQAFGEGEVPLESDYFYFPLTDRMYKINTVYDFKEFMYKSTYHKAIAKTWEDRENVGKEEFQDKLNSMLNFEDLLESEYYGEAEATLLNIEHIDKYREEIDGGLEIVDCSESIENTNLFKNFYNLDTSTNEIALSYQFSQKTDFSFGFWFVPYENDFYLLDIDKNKLKVNPTNIVWELCTGHLSIIHTLVTCELIALWVNYSKEYGYASISIYDIDETSGELTELNTTTIDLNETISMFNGFKLLKSNTLIGNIQILNKAIPKNEIENTLGNMVNTKNHIVFDRVIAPICGEKLNRN